jgi:hypothetical protein
MIWFSPSSARKPRRFYAQVAAYFVDWISLGFAMPKALALSILVAAIFLPPAAHAQQVATAADLRYCAQLSELYVRYVGRSEAGPDVPVKPDVNGGVALAKCHAGDAAAAIPILERKLRNAGFTLPPRG